MAIWPRPGCVVPRLPTVTSRGQGIIRLAKVLLGVVLVVIVAAFVLPHSPAHPHWYGNDAAVYWHGAKTFAHAGDLYAVQPGGVYFTYPPFAALVFTPLVLLPLASAQTAVVLLGASLTVALTFVSCKAAGIFRREFALGALAVSAPAMLVYVSISGYVVGQVDALVALLVLVDTVRPESRRLPRGVLVGLAIAVKVTPLVFLGAMLVRGRWRQAAVTAATAAGCVIVASMPRPQDLVTYLTSALGNTSHVGPVSVVQNQSLAGLVARANGSNAASLTGSQRVAWVLACLVVVGLGTYVVRRLGDQVVPVTLAAALVGVLVSPISWMHHWIWMVPAVVCLAGVAVRRHDPLAGLLAVSGLVVCSYGPQWFFPSVSPYSLVDLVGVDGLVIWGLVTLACLPLVYRRCAELV